MLLLSSSSKKQQPQPTQAMVLSGVTGHGTPTRDSEWYDSLLIALVDASLSDPQALPAAREDVRREMGDDALVDAAGVMGSFQAYNRIVDATGVPLDDLFSAVTKDLQEKHGYERFSSKRRSDVSELLSTVHRVSAPVARWLLRKGMEQAERVRNLAR